MEEAIKIFFRSITNISTDEHKKRISYLMPKLEVDCMRRSLDLDTRALIAPGMPKLHKGKGSPPPRRLVVAVVGSTFHFISRWEDARLRQLIDQTPSCVKNSNDAVLILNVLDELDDDIFLFAADAIAIHPSINTEEGLTCF